MMPGSWGACEGEHPAALSNAKGKMQNAKSRFRSPLHVDMFELCILHCELEVSTRVTGFFSSAKSSSA